MSRKLLILLLAAVMTAGLAAQSVADQYGFLNLSSSLVTGRASDLLTNATGTVGFQVTGYGVAAADLTDPLNPDELGVVQTPGFSYSAVMAGDNMVVADGNGMTILNVANPSAMGILSWTPMTGSIRSVAVNDLNTYAFCAVEGVGLVIVNITDPINPIMGQTVALNGTAYSLVWAAQHVFVALGTAGMAVVDVTDPANPGTPAYADTPGQATGVAVELTQNLAMVADGLSGVALVSLNNFVPTYTNNVTTRNRAIQISFIPQYAVVTEIRPDSLGGTVQYLDYTGTEVNFYRTAGAPFTTKVLGTTAFIAEGLSGIEVVNFGVTPAVLLTTYQEPAGGPRAMDKSGNIAYVANYSAGLAIVDMSSFAAPEVLATVPTGLWCYDVFVNNNFAYALDFNGTITVVDVSVPSSPRVVTTTQLEQGGSRSMAYLNGHIYIGLYGGSEFNYHALVYSVTNDTVLAWAYSAPTVALGIDVKGVTVQDNKLFLSACDTSSNTDNSGVYIYDITTPAQPSVLGYYHTNGNARMTAVNGNRMYVAVESEGLHVVNIENPALPVQLGSTITFEEGGAYGVTYSDNKLFVAHWGGGMTALDVTNPDTPVWYGRVNSPGLAYEAFVWDPTHVLLCDSYSLEVYELSVVGVSPDQGAQTPVTFKLNGTYPNPFNATTMISFSLPVAGQVDVTVYDAMGRAVALPFSGTLSAGQHQVSFNAAALTSGVYFLQVSSPWGEQSGKMVLLK